MIVTREAKGDALTIEEVDNNFTELSSRVHIDIVPPTINNDSLESFVANKSMWLDSSTDKMYKCTDATLGSAVWEELRLRETYFTDSMCVDIATFQQDLLENEVFEYTFSNINKAYLLHYQVIQKNINGVTQTRGNTMTVSYGSLNVWEWEWGNEIINGNGSGTTEDFSTLGVFTFTNSFTTVAKIKVKIQEILI